MSVNLSNKLSIKDVPASTYKGKRVLIRVDFNVPISSDGKVSDKTRIVEAIPTIKYILQQQPKYIVLMSHRGRPDGQKNEKYTLQPIVSTIEQELGKPVKFVSDVIGSEVDSALQNASNGQVLLLENLRFYLEEEGKGKKDGKKVKADKQQVEAFRKKLSSYGDLYVNDAFGTAHRAHSSVVGINTSSGLKLAGLLLEKELKAFSTVLNPDTVPRPYVAILGGAKVTDKIPVINSLLDRVNTLIIGGGMAFTFKKVINQMEIGKSLYDSKGAETVQQLVQKAKEKNVKIVLPIDFIAAEKFPTGKLTDESALVKTQIVTEQQGIPAGYMGLDIGPKSGVLFASHLWNAKTIVFNGPMGVFEYPAFVQGTLAVLHATAAATQLNKAVSVLGGGDSVAAANQFGFTKYLTHLSTGGGASLELLEGKDLPGLVALSDKDKLKSKL